MKKQLTALLLSGALVCALAGPALAAETVKEIPAVPVEETKTELQPASVLYYGSVKEITTDEDGTISAIWMESQQSGECVMKISANTLWVDSGKKTQDDPADLAVGEKLYVFHSPVSTRSMPPQTQAFVMVRNIPQDVGCAQYFVVQQVKGEKGALELVTDREERAILVNDKTELCAYGSEEVPALETIQAGSRVMVWYAMKGFNVATPLTAAGIMVLPEETKPLKEGDTLKVQLDGVMTELTGRYESGAAMVPVAAVGRAMGFTVEYAVTEDGEQVTVESETFSVLLRFGEEMIIGVTKIPDAVGMTAPQRYGAAVYAVAPGTTWAPAQLFEMLGKTVTLQGDVLDIR